MARRRSQLVERRVMELKKNVKSPLAVKDYNTFMGGVDLADRYRMLYDVNRKSKKWWHRLFFALLDICFVNAYVIYTQIFDKLPLLDFRRSLSLGLIVMNSLSTSKTKKNSSAPLKTKEKGRKRSLSLPVSNNELIKRRKTNYSVGKDVRLNNRGGHWPVFTPKRGRCEECSLNKIQSKPMSKCSQCKVYLCVNEKKNCFCNYHDVDPKSFNFIYFDKNQLNYLQSVLYMYEFFR